MCQHKGADSQLSYKPDTSLPAFFCIQIETWKKKKNWCATCFFMSSFEGGK